MVNENKNQNTALWFSIQIDEIDVGNINHGVILMIMFLYNFYCTYTEFVRFRFYLQKILGSVSPRIGRYERIKKKKNLL